MRHTRQRTPNTRFETRALRPGEHPLHLAPQRNHRSVPLQKKPEWLKVRVEHGEDYRDLKGIMRGLDLHTVCEEAGCPNIYECWNQRTATLMILGDTCTRACRFCGIKWGRPTHLDRAEPKRVAAAVQAMGLRHAVITSV